MEKYTETRIDDLSAKQVGIVTEQKINVDGQEITLNQTRVAYTNSGLGRQALQMDVAEPYLSAILAVWGDTPTVEGSEPDMPQERPAE